MAGRMILPSGSSSGPSLLTAGAKETPYSSTFPLSSGSYNPGFGSQLPTTPGAARVKAYRAMATNSQSMITCNVLAAAWSDYDYNRELFPGQPLFSLSLGLKTAPMTHILNLRHVNTFFRDGYTKYTQMMARTLDPASGTFKRGSSIAEKDGYLTPDQYDKLMLTHTAKWNKLDFIQAILADDSKSDFHCIRFVFAEGMKDRIKFYGFMKGRISEDLDIVQLECNVHGTIDSVENVFGAKLQAGDKIGWVITRYRTGALGIVPWFGATVPNALDACYFDVTEHERVGEVYFLGTCDLWVEDYEFIPGEMESIIGLTELITSRPLKGPELGSIRISIHTIPGRQFHECF